MALSTRKVNYSLEKPSTTGLKTMYFNKLLMLFDRAKSKVVNVISHIPFLLLLCYSDLSCSAPTPTILPAEEGHFITLIDRENTYFGAISSRVRITGSTSFTTNSLHNSLVYMSDGVDRTLPELPYLGGAYNIEIWEDNPAVPSPYLGLQCWRYQSDCQSSIYRPNSTFILDNGFRVKANGDSRVINPRISQGYVNFLSSLPVGESYSTDINYCWSSNYSDPVNYPCKNPSPTSANYNWQKKTITLKKQGQLRIETSPLTLDLMVASNGDFWLLPGSHDCEPISVSRLAGVACLFIKHDLQLATPTNLDVITLSPVINDSRLPVVTNNDFQISTDKSKWFARGQKMPFSELKKSNSIFMFLSKNMLKKISRIPPPRNLKDMFSLVLDNSLHYASGRYEIKGSADVNISERMMSVTIREKDGLTHPVKSGAVGRDIIEFEYLITESATTPSESLEVSVQQDRGSPYKRGCTFYPPNDTTPGMAVVIPASILFSDRVGSYKNVSEQVYCDGTPVDLRQHYLTETRQPIFWTEPDGVIGTTRFYDISLLFDLKSKNVTQTVAGEQWEGEVYQSGTISVKSVWK